MVCITFSTIGIVVLGKRFEGIPRSIVHFLFGRVFVAPGRPRAFPQRVHDRRKHAWLGLVGENQSLGHFEFYRCKIGRNPCLCGATQLDPSFPLLPAMLVGGAHTRRVGGHDALERGAPVAGKHESVCLGHFGGGDVVRHRAGPKGWGGVLVECLEPATPGQVASDGAEERRECRGGGHCLRVEPRAWLFGDRGLSKRASFSRRGQSFDDGVAGGGNEMVAVRGLTLTT